MANLSKIRTLVREDASLLRNIKEYNQQLRKIDAAKTIEKRKKFSTDYGINQNSALNALKHFDILDGLPPYPFHNILEGSITRELQYILKHYLLGKKKIMSLDEFNRKIVEFDYSYFETKPSIILPQHWKDGANLQETGMQIWHLSVILPFILGPYIEHGDPYWENYLLLLEISSSSFAHEISLTMIDYWKNIIEDYLTTFQSLHQTHLTPKQHFLIHYPSLTLKFGPLYQFNILRPEAKHQFFKDLMRKNKSKKSITNNCKSASIVSNSFH